MPWPLILVRPTEESYELPNGIGGHFYVDDAGTKYTWDNLPIGACWFAEGNWQTKAAPYFEKHNAHRKPLWVKMPGGHGGTAFCVDSIASTGGEGWEVTGEPPKITVHPSIHIIGRYHGWIRDGVITDDCDGRTFP